MTLIPSIPFKHNILLSQKEIEDWISMASPLPKKLNFNVDEIYATYLPRVRFIKTLPINCRLVDAGAGDGGLLNFKKWLDPARDDLVFWGSSLTHSGITNQYDEFCEALITPKSPIFSGKADALIACHLIEHLDTPSTLFKWANTILYNNSRIYLEWPSPHTINLPKASELSLPADILRPQTLNFYDDSSHIEPISPELIISLASDHGYQLVASGYVENEYIADLMRDCAIGNSNPFYITAATWLKVFFSTYLVFSR
jgi:hypothetical protein